MVVHHACVCRFSSVEERLNRWTLVLPRPLAIRAVSTQTKKIIDAWRHIDFHFTGPPNWPTTLVATLHTAFQVSRGDR